VSLGVLLDADGVEPLMTFEPEAGPRAAWIALTAEWPEVERIPGTYDWAEVAGTIRSLDAAGFRVALCLTGSHPFYLPEGALPSPQHGDSLAAWLSFVADAGERFAAEVDLFQVWDRSVGSRDDLDPEVYAFMLKNTALALRSEARSAGQTIRVAQLSVPAEGIDWQRRLWEEDSAAYVDVVPIILAPPEGEGVRAFLSESLLHPPVATIWAQVGRGEGSVEAALGALSEGASVALVDVRGVTDPSLVEARWALGANDALSEGHAPAPLGELQIVDDRGRPVEGAQVLARFFSDQDFTTLIFYRLPGDSGAPPRDRLVVDTNVVRDARIIDLLTGEILRVGGSRADRGQQRSVRLRAGPQPLAIRFQAAVASPGFELPLEEVETTRRRGLTAEEIIARYQQVQKFEDDHLDRWLARGRIDYHFKLAQGGQSIDVGIDCNYFWERGAALEWEQIRYYLNGNKVGWKNFPELPLLQPERVMTLPLDLTLDRTYAYRLVGMDRIDGREAYVLEFQPETPDASSNLYRGRVWIDAGEFVRLRLSLVQTGLDPPVLSNEETDRFDARLGPSGKTFWMLDKVDGQQTWTAAGRTFIVQRKVRFLEFEINPDVDHFEEQRQVAYASRNKMLRETPEGFRYLKRQEDGTRIVNPKVDDNQLFVAAGAFNDRATDGVVPLAGVNYFDYDLWDKGVQVNAFFGGVLGFLTAAKPGLWGTRMDASLDFGFRFIDFGNEVFIGDTELTTEEVDTNRQSLALRLGVPVGEFVRFNFIGRASYESYSESENSAAAIDLFNAAHKQPQLEFILPQDHVQGSFTAAFEYNRRGYSLLANTSWATRSEWDPWGMVDSQTGQYLVYDPTLETYVPTEPDSFDDSFARWGIGGFKEWYLTSFQKARLDVNLLGGTSLDRFSRYQFSFFGDDRLFGFSGSGVRFDEGAIARAGYSFNVFEIVRLDAALENAWVRERDQPTGTQSFTGVGLSGNVVGPWKTVVSLNYGYALKSDIPDLEGEQEFLLIILKLF
jgi:hypothetical protein